MREELRLALENGEILPYYQPIVDTRTREVVRLEALARWERPTGAVPPDEFIAVAERSGLAVPLLRLMITHALGDARVWRERIPDLRVSVNVSAVALARTHLPEELLRTISLAGGEPSWLALEVTEGALAQDPERVSDHVCRLRAAGLRVSIDDFGIGYSSLAHLRTMRVDSVKIDRQFVGRIGREPISDKIVQFVVQLCHDLEIRAVAEGVETRQAWAHLVDAGCDDAQGWFIARAMPAGDVRAWLDAWSARSIAAERTELSN